MKYIILKHLTITLVPILFIPCTTRLAAQESQNNDKIFQMSIESMMQYPKWIGTSPSRIFWSEDGKTLYMEGHGFREPSSWTDEYKRIFKLFEENLGGKNSQ